MPNSKVFVSHNILPEGIDLLKKAGLEVDIWPLSTAIPENELLSRSSDCDAIITMLGNKIDAEFIAQCPKLKVISNYAVGFNNIDILEATRRKISVGNTPNVLTDATADLAMALLLNLSRKIIPAAKNVKDGQWMNWEPMGFLGKSLKGKTLGIFGMGRIGRAFAKRCVDGFGMKLIYCANSNKGIGEKVSLDKLIERSDVLSLHSPLNEKTRGIFNYEILKKTKNDLILINTARGEIVVEKDLEKLLNEGHFYGVGLDVTDPEPIDPNSALLKYERVLVTPHIGSADYETRKAMSLMAAENILAGLSGTELPGFVNPEVRKNEGQ